MTRNKKGKKGKRKIFILVEGKTEQMYFDCLRQQLRLSNVKIKTTVMKNSGRTWIEKAKLLIENDPSFRRDKATEVFVVFDKDEFTSNELKQMFKRAEEENFGIGFSNATFEIWLLAHFEAVTAKVLSKAAITNKLEVHLKNDYIKADSDQLDKMIKNLDLAVKNARSISEINFESQSTNIGELISNIRS
ncbi:RloB family protein [Pseudolactococcus insecticola]|uniref:RloB domain-containing protein n=1 Tax=Pseudolactococcus insecticola TaxID=2709158 RepID=A0A6A0B603_9LACT|nr:RloB family protein [Lactococcus insecticola]GFH39971.1 hypothetical protein Hs20B_03690 [Lactococcus insecticola]